MSSVEIFGFGKNGGAYKVAGIQNSWRGGMAIWRILEEKYLAGIYSPPSAPACIPYRCIGFKVEVLKEILALFDNKAVSVIDRIVLGSTLDGVIVKKEDFPRLIEAFNAFEGETNLKEQAVVIKKLLENENCVAAGWNQTSVNGDTWDCYGYNEETDESIPYNIFSGDEHWFLFDEI
jgi:hypothetical protein